MAMDSLGTPKTHHVRIGDIVVFPEIGRGAARVMNVSVTSSTWEEATLEIQTEKVPLEMAKEEHP